MKQIAYIILAVTLLSSCTKDRVNAPGNNVLVTPGNRVLLYYWDCNKSDSVGLVSLTYSDTNYIKIGADTPRIQIPRTASTVNVTYDQYTPGTFINARRTSDSGGALRVRNPCTYMILHIPMNGYKSAILSFATIRSNSGSILNNISYTINGTNYLSANISNDAISINDTSWVSSSFHTIDFTNVPGVDDNPKFAVKIYFANADIATVGNAAKGNDRYDNITVDAYRK
jgi:hypothetical protein